MMEDKPEYCRLLERCMVEETDEAATQTDKGSNSSRTIFTVFGRWPSVLTSTCAVFCCLLLIFLLVLLILLWCLNLTSESVVLTPHDMLLFTVRSFCPAPLTYSGNPSSYTMPPFFEKKDIPSLSHREPPLDNFFYVLFNNPDALTPRQMCAIESTASINSIKNSYVLYLTGVVGKASSTNSTGTQLKLSDLLRTYSNLKRFDIPAKHFFKGSPIELNWSKLAPYNMDLLKFIARVLALWRFGGISYDTKLVNIKIGSTEYLQKNSLGMVVEPGEGHVLSASQPCEALLFEIINTLKTACEKKTMSDLDADSLMDQATHVFCNANNSDIIPCPGVTFLESSDICPQKQNSVIKNDYSECFWVKHNIRMAKQWKQFCPVTENLLKSIA